jgi:hypothetical protein
MVVMTMWSNAYAGAGAVTLLPFGGESVHPHIRSAARDALAIFLTDNGVEVRGNSAKETPANTESADTVAKAAKAPRYIRGQITRLGQKAIVQVSVFSVGRSTPTASYRLTAATPSDLETVMQRLAKSVATGKKATETQDIKTITAREQMKFRRIRANNYFGITIGGTAPLAGDAEFLSGFGFSWLWDNRNVLLGAEYRIAGLGNDESTFWDLSVAGYYPFSETDFTFYVGGGLSLSSITRAADKDFDGDSCISNCSLFEDDSATGLSFFASVGALIGRTSTVSLRPDLGYFVSTYTIDDSVIHGVRVGLTLGF